MRSLTLMLRRPWLALGLVAVLIAVVGPAAGRANEPPGKIARSEVNEAVRLMVQLQSAPLAEENSPGQADRIRNEQNNLREQLRLAGIRYSELSAHQKLFNGLTVQVRSGEAGRISSLPGVAAVHVSSRTHAPKPDLASSVKMVGADRAWAGDPARQIPGVDGTGVTVAVIDTGIDYTHPDLGGCFGPGCKVVAGYDFVGDKFGDGSPPVPDTDPRDQNGHGTHVAGIVGAKAASPEGVTGVAPGVKLVALKVFGPDGSTFDDVILQALEAALDMQVDVVNISLGSAFQWPQYPTAQAVQRLQNKGIFVAASAGNSGASGEFASGAPSVGSGAVSVASFENDFVLRSAFLDGKSKPMPYQTMIFSPEPPTEGQSAELVHVGLGASDSDFLNPDGSSKVHGKVALIQRGVVTFKEKSERAQKHGAVQVVVYNNRPGGFNGTLQQAGTYVPTLAISREGGLQLLAQMQEGQVRLTWTAKRQQFRNDTAGLISDFSSLGPTPDLSLKPDVTAPGGSIYSTWLMSDGKYATLSGTSMSSPHVAGAAALIIQGKGLAGTAAGGKSPAQVKRTALRTLMMNTATPRTEGADGKLYPVWYQGAGMIDAWKAINARQRVLPEKIALGAVSAGAVIDQRITIENIGSQPETYTFEVVGGYAAPGLTLAASPASMTVKARQTGQAHIQLTIPADLPDQKLFSGWIAVKNSQGEVVARIPYLGFMGNYQAASTLDTLKPFNLPWLARLDGIWLRKSEEIEIHPGCECDAEFAWIIFSLARQPRELRMEIWDDATKQKRGNVFKVEYVGRSDGGIEALVWDAMNDKGRKVPAGEYRLRLLSLKPLGDPSDPAHWDVWTSGKIKVVYD